MNIQLDTETIVIFWKQRSWKTLLSQLFAIDYIPNLFSNVPISIKDFWVVSEKFDKISQLLDYSHFKKTQKPSLMIVDEVGMKIPRSWKHPVFKCTLFDHHTTWDWYELREKKSLIIDIISILKKYNITYDTTYTSIIEDDSKEFLEEYWSLFSYRKKNL